MYVCMYVCMYVFMYVCIYVHAYNIKTHGCVSTAKKTKDIQLKKVVCYLPVATIKSLNSAFHISKTSYYSKFYPIYRFSALYTHYFIYVSKLKEIALTFPDTFVLKNYLFSSRVRLHAKTQKY